MKNVFLVLAVFLIVSSLRAQDFSWAKRMGRSTNHEVGLSIAVDQLKNVYTCGLFADTTDFDPGPGTFNLVSSGLDDFYITKFDSLGNFIWAKQIGGPLDYESISFMDVDAQGNIFMAGAFKGTVDFDPSAGTHNLTSAAAGSAEDVFLAKYTTAGNLVWVKQLGGIGDDEPTFIKFDGAGHVYATGTFRGTVDFDPGNGLYSLTSFSTTDAFVMKLDTAGNFIWAVQIGGASSDVIIHSATTDPSNVYLTGQFYGTVDFGGYTLTSVSGGTDAFVCRFDANGIAVWAHRIGGPGSAVGYSITAGNGLNLYITGFFEGTANFVFNPSVNLTSMGGDDAFVCKMDIFNNFYWVKQFASPNSFYESGRQLLADNAGNIYLSGVFDGTTDLDPGSGTYTIPTSATSEAYFVRLDGSGNFVWAVATASSNQTTSLSTAIDAAGNLYATGTFEGTTDFNPRTAVYPLTDAGNGDAFVFKLQPVCFTADTIDISICQGESYSFGNSTLTTAGTYFDTLVSSAGCDSVVTLNLTVHANPTASIAPATIIICNGNNITLTASGSGSPPVTYTWSNGGGNNATAHVSPASTVTYTVTVTDANNCQATASRAVIVNQSNAETVSVTTCFGSTYPFNGQNLSTAGTYFDTLTNAAGCDSVVTLNLSFNSFVSSSYSQSICGGDSLFFHGGYLTATGVYTDTLTASGGCDSIITLNLTVADAITDTLYAAICDGGYYLFGNRVYSSTGIYYDTAQASSGCDSVVTLSLTVNPLPQPLISQNTHMLTTGNFAGYQWLLEGNEIDGATLQELHLIQNGNYSVIVTDTNGCSDTSAVFNVTGVGIGGLTMSDGRWTVYPNPNNGNFTLEFSDNETKEIVITDMVGKEIVSGIQVTAHQEFHLNEKQGIYFIRITEKSKSRNIKFVIVR